MEYDELEVALRATLIYAIGVVFLRISKKRLLKGMSVLDILVVVMLGSLLSRGITGNASVLSTVVATLSVLGCHWILSFLTIHSHRLGNILKGEAIVLIKNGTLDREAALREHITQHDLAAELRRNGTTEVADIIEGRLERDGSITLLRRKESDLDHSKSKPCPR